MGPKKNQTQRNQTKQTNSLDEISQAQLNSLSNSNPTRACSFALYLLYVLRLHLPAHAPKPAANLRLATKSIVYNAPAREVNRQGKSKAIAVPRPPPATNSKYLNRQPRQGATYCYLLA
jgi:hypothetical protein